MKKIFLNLGLLSFASVLPITTLTSCSDDEASSNTGTKTGTKTTTGAGTSGTGTSGTGTITGTGSGGGTATGTNTGGTGTGTSGTAINTGTGTGTGGTGTSGTETITGTGSGGGTGTSTGGTTTIGTQTGTGGTGINTGTQTVNNVDIQSNVKPVFSISKIADANKYLRITFDKPNNIPSQDVLINQVCIPIDQFKNGTINFHSLGKNLLDNEVHVDFAITFSNVINSGNSNTWSANVHIVTRKNNVLFSTFNATNMHYYVNVAGDMMINLFNVPYIYSMNQLTNKNNTAPLLIAYGLNQGWNKLASNDQVMNKYNELLTTFNLEVASLIFLPNQYNPNHQIALILRTKTTK